MKKLWKQVLTGTLAMAAAGVLTGCGGGNTGSSNSTANGAATASAEVVAGSETKAAEVKGDIAFSWWGNDDRHKLTQDTMKRFQEIYPGIKVEGQPSGFGSLDEQFATRYAGGTEADVMTIQFSWVSQYSPNGDGFYDLAKVADIVDLSQYDSEFLKFGQTNGIQQAVPHGKNVLCFMVNKSAYERVGLDVPATWEEYKAAAEKFPAGTYLLVSPTFRFAATYYLQQVTGMTEFNDVGELNYTEDDYKNAMLWYKELADAGVWCSRKDYLENVGTEPVSVAQNAKYINGGYVGVFEWIGGIASNAQTLKDNGDDLVIAPLPVVEGAKFKGSIAKPTMMMAISKNSKSPEAAAIFLQFILNDPEGTKLMGTSRGVPASKAAVEALKADGQIDGAVAAGYEFGSTAPVMNETPFYENGMLNNIYMQQYERFEMGQATVEEAAQEVYEQTKTQAAKLAGK